MRSQRLLCRCTDHNQQCPGCLHPLLAQADQSWLFSCQHLTDCVRSAPHLFTKEPDMPFTPLHMGPGLLIKALLQGSFSLLVFGWAQILMDIQPLLVLLIGEGHLHGFSHTYIGASLLALAAALSGKYLAEFGLRLIDQQQFLPISWTVACESAFIGTFSHVVLDSIMHADVEPFWPLSMSNELLGLVTIEQLHWFCIGSGLLGAVLYVVLVRVRLSK
jgi:membrane-bound metal-dependent hydrolase YbcI (DUF457 family)